MIEKLAILITRKIKVEKEILTAKNTRLKDFHTTSRGLESRFET